MPWDFYVMTFIFICSFIYTIDIIIKDIKNDKKDDDEFEKRWQDCE